MSQQINQLIEAGRRYERMLATAAAIEDIDARLIATKNAFMFLKREASRCLLAKAEVRFLAYAMEAFCALYAEGTASYEAEAGYRQAQGHLDAASVALEGALEDERRAWRASRLAAPMFASLTAE